MKSTNLRVKKKKKIIRVCEYLQKKQQTLKILYSYVCYVYFLAPQLLLFNHTHLVVLSIVLIITSMVFFFGSFQTRSLHRDLAMKPVEPISIGIQLVYHPFFFFFFFFFFFSPHFSRSSYLYFFRSWASSVCSSYGTVNSHINILFILFENISLSGCNDVWAIWTGNFNHVSKSAYSFQSVASASAFGVFSSLGLAFTPALTNLTKFFW